jgi:selenocysteine-specific elongation factor
LKIPAGQLPHLRTVLLAMERQGRIVKIATDLYFSRAAADTAKDRLVDYLQTHNEITAAVFRDLLGASRKFAIALLDHFDHTGVTTRVGDTRRLRSQS